jgi:hypothetical protein
MSSLYEQLAEKCSGKTEYNVTRILKKHEARSQAVPKSRIKTLSWGKFLPAERKHKQAATAWS